MGEKVFLKVSPMKEVLRIGKKNKLDPQYVGPFEKLVKIRPVAYRLALPPEMERIHNVFHVSQLRKYVSDPTMSYPTNYCKFMKTYLMRENLYKF